MIGKFGGFFKETVQELNKVTWPSKDELWQSTGLVIFTTFLMSAFIGVVDFCLSMIMRILVR